MWNCFEQSPLEDETINNAFSSRGIFKIRSEEEVENLPHVEAFMQNKKMAIAIEKSLFLLEDELVAKCSLLGFQCCIDVMVISQTGNLIICGLRNGQIHGIFIKGINIFNVAIKDEDVQQSGKTFASIQQLDKQFLLTCTNGSVYSMSAIDERPLETLLNLPVDSESFVFDDRLYADVTVIQLFSKRVCTDVNDAIVLAKCSGTMEQNQLLHIAVAQSAVYFRIGPELSRVVVPSIYGNVARIYNLENFLLILTGSGHLLEVCPITKTVYNQNHTKLLIADLIVMECNDETIELLVITKGSETEGRALKVIEYPSFKCNSNLHVEEHTWLVQQSKSSINLYYINGGSFNQKQIPTEIEMMLVTETHPNDRFKKLIAKGHLEEAEEFGKQFELCLQPIYEAKAKRVLLQMKNLNENNPEKLEECFNSLLQLMRCIESAKFFKLNRLISLPTRSTVERYLKEILLHLNKETDKTDVVEVNEQLHRLETLKIIDANECNTDWQVFVYHPNLVKMIIQLFKTDVPTACLIWKRHSSAIIPKLDEKELQKLLSLIPNNTEAFQLVQWLKQFVPTISNTHPAVMPFITEWSIQKTRSLQHSLHWPDIGLEFSTKVLDIFEEIQFIHLNVRRQHERNIAKLRELVNALQDLVVLKKSYNLSITLEKYMQDSIDETALYILQHVHLDSLKSFINNFLYPIFQEKNSTPVASIRHHIAQLIANRNTFSTWLERAVVCIDLLHNEDDRMKSALLVLQNAPVPWPDTVTPLMKLRYSTHPLATKISTACELQALNIMKVKYGWSVDSLVEKNPYLLMSRIVKENFPDMLTDIRILKQVIPSIAIAANFNCCYQLVSTERLDVAFEFFKELKANADAKYADSLIEMFAQDLETFAPSDDAASFEQHKLCMEFLELITEGGYSNYKSRLFNVRCCINLKQRYALHIKDIQELQSVENRLKLLDHGIENIIKRYAKSAHHSYKYIYKEAATLAVTLRFGKVFGITRISQRLQSLPLSCALAFAVLESIECTAEQVNDFINLALELIKQQILQIKNASTMSKLSDYLAFLLAYELLQRAAIMESRQLHELTELLMYMHVVQNAYGLTAIADFYIDRDDEINAIISQSLGAADMVNGQQSALNCSLKGEQTKTKRYSFSAFDDDQLIQPELQANKPSFDNDRMPIVEFMAYTFLLMLTESAPTNCFLQQLSVQLLKELNTDTNDVRNKFHNSLEKLVKNHMHDVWYKTVQYLLEYEVQHEVQFLNMDKVGLYRGTIFKNLMKQKDVNFIDLYVMLLANDEDAATLLRKMQRVLKTDQQKLNYYALLEMYNIQIGNTEQLEVIRNRRTKHHYYMLFSKQDPSIRDKFKAEVDSMQILMKELNNKKLDVTLIDNISRDFKLDFQQLLVEQIINILRVQKLEFEIKIDAFGEEKIVMLCTVEDIRKQCEPYLKMIKKGDLLAAKLKQFIAEINNYFYEIYLCVIEILNSLNAMPTEMEIWASILHFLQHKMVKRRRNRPGQLEHDFWMQTQADNGVLPKIARYRLPFKQIVEHPLKDTINDELCVDNCESWFPLIEMHVLLKDSKDVANRLDFFCSWAVKNSLEEYKSKNHSETWNLQPTNDAFLKSVLRLIKHVRSPLKVFMILYFVSTHAPEGADQVEATTACYNYALENEKTISDDAQYADKLKKIKRKYPIVKTLHLLHMYGLADSKFTHLVENPVELINSLYHDELILKCSKLDLNAMMAEIAQLHNLELEEIQYRLLQKWLPFALNVADGTICDETFFDESQFHEQEQQNSDNATENVLRVCYVLKSWSYKKALQFLVANMIPSNGSTNTSKQLQMYECFSNLNDGNTCFDMFTQRNYVIIKCVHELKKLGYNYSIENFAEADKIVILNTVWKQHAQNAQTLEISANICLGFDIYHEKIWNAILKRMVKLNMVDKLNALVDVLSSKAELLHTDGLTAAWDCVLKQNFKTANVTRSFEQDELLHKTLFRLQSCPVVEKLNLVEFAEHCRLLQRPYMAAFLLAFCPDEQSKNDIKKLLNDRKLDAAKMRKEIQNLEDVGIHPAIINTVVRELDL